MPRFLVQRTYSQGLHVVPDENGARQLQAIISRNGERGVTWLHSYVTRDRSRTFCICEAPDAATIRTVAAANGLPVDQITEVRVLDPYFHY
ncbi:MAG TPA: DUF4242 domain-containing protein [Steroidobacteraceae bacterium]|jgi:hypothetical protein